MASWMLVSREWLNIALFVVFRDLCQWITTPAHLEYITHIYRSGKSFVCKLAGITEIRSHLARTCRSLIISVYHAYEGEYASLIQYATKASRRLLAGSGCYRTQEYAIPSRSVATVIRDVTPQITALHFVLIDCTATYGAWDTSEGFSYYSTDKYPLSLTELHITFAYTSPPFAFLLGAPRSTFFPPPFRGDLPLRCCFHGVQRLVVWDANADFVAFMTTVCPRLERVESTAEVHAEDVPDNVPEDVKDRLVFARLPRTATWGLSGHDTEPLPEGWPPETNGERRLMLEKKPPISCPIPPRTPPTKSKNPFWRFLTHVFRERK